jgi:hypothetical protein
MKALKILYFSIAIFICTSTFSVAQNMRGLWVWNTATVVASTNETNILINQCKVDNITEIYLYAFGLITTVSDRTKMQTFISKARCNNINVWALDGYRGYFSDWTPGPAGFNNFITTVINYNAASAANQRFYGVHGDNEPQDGQGEPKNSFHNGIPSSSLSAVAGSGVWQSTQVLDREFLMRSWCSITENAFTTCHANGMKYGIAAPSWPDDYFGEAIYCTYNTVNKRVFEHLMDYVDSYCIMTYNTNTANAANRAVGELIYASTMPAATRPLVWASVETHCGPGNTISYCDTPGKNSKAVVYADLATIVSTLNAYSAFSGMNIHDWAVTGWKEMPTASSNITDPGCALPVELLLFEGSAGETHNLLSWSTTEEINNDYFIVERSTDGINFNPCGVVESTSNDNSVAKYNFKDESILRPVLYYRLKQTDFDETISYSDIIVINRSFSTRVGIYPCPAQNFLSIAVSNLSKEELSIRITDIRGAEIMTINRTADEKGIIPIDISHLAPGVYWLFLNNKTSFSETLKFQKQ